MFSFNLHPFLKLFLPQESRKMTKGKMIIYCQIVLFEEVYLLKIEDIAPKLSYLLLRLTAVMMTKKRKKECV